MLRPGQPPGHILCPYARLHGNQAAVISGSGALAGPGARLQLILTLRGRVTVKPQAYMIFPLAGT